MKEIDRVGFRERIYFWRQKGRSLTEAINLAYAWLLLPGKKAHGK